MIDDEPQGGHYGWQESMVEMFRWMNAVDAHVVVHRVVTLVKDGLMFAARCELSGTLGSEVQVTEESVTCMVCLVREARL